MAHSEGERNRCAATAALAGQIAAALFALSGFAACTELAPGSDRLAQLTGSNVPDAGAVDVRWECLDRAAPNTAAPVTPTVDLAMTITDTVTDSVPPGLTARVCDRLDVYCQTPLVAVVTPDAEGVLHLPVSQGFDGFIELTSPSTISTMYFLNRPLMRDTVRNLAVISTVALNGLAMQARLMLDPTLGHVLMTVFDCAGELASDVQLLNAAGGVPFVFIDGLPTVGRSVTSEAGIGGFVNVPMGYAVLEGRRAGNDRLLGTTNVLVRPLWFSYSDVQPLPP